MKDFIFEPINTNTIQKCHELNEKNVPNVGSRSLKGLTNSLENSDYSECILFRDQVVGFVICFLDSEITKSYMQQIDHKNFREISNRVSNFLYIDRIAVDTEYRNRKLGSQLYSNIVDFSKNNSITSLTAEINLLPSINISSFEFHKKFNFYEIDTVKYSEDYEVSLQKKEIN
tara:strand:+ start:858 stop:1376 length:519 start_codon:yes stop_codon:yes gene_type:complete